MTPKRTTDLVGQTFVLQNFLVLALLTIQTSSGAKILVTLTHPLSQASHNAFVGRITSGLVWRNHSVTAVVADTHNLHGFKENAASSILKFKVNTPTSIIDNLVKEISKNIPKNPGLFKTIELVTSLNAISAQNCEDMFNNKEFMDHLREQNFDLLLTEMFLPCDALLAEYLKVPFVVATASYRYAYFDEDIYNMELPSSYVPFQVMGKLTDEMGFTQRLQNFMERYVLSELIHHIGLKPFRAIQMKHSIGMGSSILELAGKAELWLCQIDFALEFAHPTAPNWIPIGGIMASSTSKPLNQDLEDFVQGSGDDGIVVFSLGSMDFKLLSDENSEFFAQAFSELQQRVIWRFDGTPPRNLGKNTRLLKWLPQADLLAHPKTRLLIYHGGINGVYEAIRYKVPMILIPLFADQPAISARVEKKGMGVVLQKTKLSVTTIKDAIERVLNDQSFKANVEKFGSIHLDVIASPLDTAMFWIEHVLKFGGSHLKSRAGELNFIARNSLDVILFVFVAVSFGLYLNILLIRFFYRCLCGKQQLKTKSD